MNSVKVSRQSGKTRLIFEPVLSIASARDLHTTLSSVLTMSAPILLDASQVERVDTAALQLLVAFVRAARDAGLKPRWHTPNPVLHEAGTLLDLGESFAAVTP